MRNGWFRKYRSHHHQTHDIDKFSFNVPLGNKYNTLSVDDCENTNDKNDSHIITDAYQNSKNTKMTNHCKDSASIKSRMYVSKYPERNALPFRNLRSQTEILQVNSMNNGQEKLRFLGSKM